MSNTKHISAAATFKVKADGDAVYTHGKVTALVSVFNNVDLVGDRIMPGAFKKSLQSIETAGKSIPFVWSHQWDNPDAYIGKIIDAKETQAGLEVTAALFDTATAQHIKTLLREGVVTEFSFAYDVVTQKEGSDGVNQLLEVNILEAGPTLKGANPATALINVRSAPRIDDEADTSARHDDEEEEDKAEAGGLDVGNFVTWDDGYGRIEHIVLDGFFGVDNDPLSLEATAENPLAMVRVYDATDGGYVATEMFIGYRFSELTLAEEQETVATASVEKSSVSRTGFKVGRTISSKNEERLQTAKDLLVEVLSTLDAKTQEPTQVKVAEHDDTALLYLLQIELLNRL